MSGLAANYTSSFASPSGQLAVTKAVLAIVLSA
jgi:hypothetical protein